MVLLTRLDYFVNGILYEYGLIFDWSWYMEYQFLYNLLWQISIFILFYYCRNLYFLFLSYAFYWSASQDIFFFVAWVGDFPSGDWTWSSHYLLFGHWSTVDHIGFCLVINLLAIIFCVLLKFSSLKDAKRLLSPVEDKLEIK